MAQYPCCCCDPISVSLPSCPSGNCLMVASLIVNPDTSALPCGGNASVNVAAESDLTKCTTGVNWGLLSWDTDVFTAVSISSAGVLSFTTTTSTALNTFYVFTGKATCTGTLLSQYFTVKVAVRDACISTICSVAGQVCNPCTGLCIDPPDVELF